MIVQDIMKTDVATIEDEALLSEACKVMRDRNVGALPVLCEGDLVGFITDRDIVLRCCAEGKNVESCKVSDCMTPMAVTIHQDQDLEFLGEVFRQNKVRRAVVVDDQDKVVGIVNLSDLAKHRARPAVETFEDIKHAS